LALGEPTQLLPDGTYLYAGCRTHSCDEKVAVIATPQGSVLAAGVIHFNCYKKEPVRASAKRCDDRPRLTVLSKDAGASGLRHRDALRAWAKSVSDIALVETKVIP
jgi:hypothetical protein